MNKDLRSELGKRLEEIAREIKGLKRKKGKISRQYIPYVKNPLMGYASLWGTRDLRNLPKHKEPGDRYRDLFFQDIRFKSKLSKINKRISSLEDDYQKTLHQIKEEENATNKDS